MPDNSPLQSRGWVWRGGALPDSLELHTLSVSPLQSGEVLVRNYAIGLNPVDWKVLDTQIGMVPGVDGAGEVVAVGADVDTGWLGARVAYHQSLTMPGSFAEHTAVNVQVLLRLPHSLDYVSAAAFPCPALTALQAIEKIPVRAGAPVLVAGAGGSVGHYLVQLAHSRGFEVIISSSERHWTRLKTLGASECIDNPLMRGRQPYYAVIDATSPEQAERLSLTLQANGHLVCIQGRVVQWPCAPFGRALSMHEVALGALHTYGDAQQWQALTQQGEQMLNAQASGKLRGEMLLTFPFETLSEQLQALQHRNFSGKQIIQLKD